MYELIIIQFRVEERPCQYVNAHECHDMIKISYSIPACVNMDNRTRKETWVNFKVS